MVADDVWPANSPEAGVNKSLDSLHSGDGGSPGFGSIEQYRLHDGVEDPDFNATFQIIPISKNNRLKLSFKNKVAVRLKNLFEGKVSEPTKGMHFNTSEYMKDRRVFELSEKET